MGDFKYSKNVGRNPKMKTVKICSNCRAINVRGVNLLPSVRIVLLLFFFMLVISSAKSYQVNGPRSHVTYNVFWNSTNNNSLVLDYGATDFLMVVPIESEYVHRCDYYDYSTKEWLATDRIILFKLVIKVTAPEEYTLSKKTISLEFPVRCIASDLYGLTFPAYPTDNFIVFVNYTYPRLETIMSQTYYLKNRIELKIKDADNYLVENKNIQTDIVQKITEANTTYKNGLKYYNSEDFDNAAPLFDKALKLYNEFENLKENSKQNIPNNFSNVSIQEVADQNVELQKSHTSILDRIIFFIQNLLR
jgi:hypothetical protein